MKNLFMVKFLIYFFSFNVVIAQVSNNDSLMTNNKKLMEIQKKIDAVNEILNKQNNTLLKFNDFIFWIVVNIFLFLLLSSSIIFFFYKLSVLNQYYAKKINKILEDNNQSNYFIQQVNATNNKIDSLFYILQNMKSEIDSYFSLDKEYNSNKNTKPVQLEDSSFPVKANPKTLILQYSERKSDFYLKKTGRSYEMYVESEIINSKPDPKFENLFNPFFQLVYSKHGIEMDNYKLITPAKVEWDEKSKSGKIIEKGKIIR